MIVRAMLVMDLFVPVEPEEGASYADPMEAFLAEAQAEFDRLMAEDPKFRAFIERTKDKFEVPNKPVLMLQSN